MRQKTGSQTYHNENDKEAAAQILALRLSDNKHFMSEDEMLHTPFTVTWLLRSTDDRSTNKAAMCLSSGDRDRDFSTASQGQTFITPPSEPDQMSPG